MDGNRLRVTLGSAVTSVMKTLDDRTSVHRFCGFFAHDHASGFVRFTRELIFCLFEQTWFEAVTDQLPVRLSWIRTGTIVDAAIMSSQTEYVDEAK